MDAWDIWSATAKAAGVDDELVQLGCEVIRDYYQHGLDATDPERQQLGGNGEYLLQLASRAPTTAFHDFTAAKVWRGASGRDGEVEAFTLLIERIGSQDAVDAALAAEEAEVQELRRVHVHA